MELRHLNVLVGTDGDDLLREDVDRVARNVRLLDGALTHRPGDDR